MIDSLGCGAVGNEKAPEELAGSSGGISPLQAGRPSGVVNEFQTLDELRLTAPIGIRVWLKLNRPLSRARRFTIGTVQEFKVDRT